MQVQATIFNFSYAILKQARIKQAMLTNHVKNNNLVNIINDFRNACTLLVLE